MNADHPDEPRDDGLLRYHASVREILERHGGTVEKFVGDAAMAVFGMPQVHEDDPMLAARAAVGIRDAVSGLGLSEVQRRACCLI